MEISSKKKNGNLKKKDKRRNERNNQVKKLLKIFSLLFNAYGEQGWWPLTPEGKTKPIHNARRPETEKQKFEVIVGAILTQNTAWLNVEKAIENLNKAKALSIEKIARIKDKELETLIRPAGYYKQKAERLKRVATYILKNYKSIKEFFNKPLDELRQELLKLKGIGNETADSILLYAAEKPIFVIDAYTKRIFSRLGFFDENISYEKAQEFFMQLPKDVELFKEYHALIVEHGKKTCRRLPKCTICCLRGRCNYNSSK